MIQHQIQKFLQSYFFIFSNQIAPPESKYASYFI